MGWLGHERQWHLSDDDVLVELPRRITDIDEMYAGPPSPELLDKYGVTLIYIGPNELNGAPRSKPDPGYMSMVPVPTARDENYPGLGWELVFEQGDVRIYRMIEDVDSGENP
jgi:uncharacterized membrane protein